MHFPISHKPHLFLALAGLALAAAVSGDPPNRPAWWLNGAPPVISGAAENNQGPANIGQAKHMVSEALRALDTVAPTVANQIRSDLGGSQEDHSDRIIDLTVSEPKDAPWIEKQKAPLLLGQLKAISRPFYLHLNTAAPAWIRAERIANGTGNSGTIFPWTATTSDDANNGVATIGQLKSVFSLRFENLAAAILDSDNDGVPDNWELEFRNQIIEIFGPNDSPSDSAFYDVNVDYGATGLTAAAYYNHLKSTGQDFTDYALFDLSTLKPSSLSDTWMSYYEGKLPVKFTSIVRGASCEGYGYFGSAALLDPNAYQKMTHTVEVSSSDDNELRSHEVLSSQITTSEAMAAKDFRVDWWATPFPEFKRFWDPKNEITLESTSTTVYHLPATALPDALKTQVETTNPAKITWHPWTSTSHNMTQSGGLPTIPATLTKTKNNGETVTTPSSMTPVNPGMDPATMQFLDVDFLTEDFTAWEADYGDESTEKYEVSGPVLWKTLSNSAYEFSKENSEVNYLAKATTKIYGSRAGYDAYGQYQKATWRVEGPEDRSHTLMVVKTYSKTDATGQSVSENKYRIIPLQAKQKLSITEEADPGADWDQVEVMLDLVPVEVVLHRRGSIAAPGPPIPRSTGQNAIYEAVTLENADYDETNWRPSSMADAARANNQDGVTEVINRLNDDDFVKLHLESPIPRMQGSIELVLENAGQGNRLRADDLRFYNSEGERIQLTDLRIADLQNPQGPLAPMLQENGLDLFIEIADLGQLTRDSGEANRNLRRYADLILRMNLGGQVNENRARIYRGGYWRNQRNGNTGTNAFYDGKGRYQDEDGAWQVDVGNLVHGPYNIRSGTGTTDSTVSGSGPTPAGWYGLYERTDFRTWWEGSARPQTDHTVGRNGTRLGYLQQGSYCQWAAAGNRTAYTHNGANPPSSIQFKFELVEAYEFTTRTNLQIHPDGFSDGTAGCVGMQIYNDCCQIFFLLRHYYGTSLRVETP